MSKIAGLPQMKVAWIAIQGPTQDMSEAQARLEVIADTFLSMSAPIQHALPGWLRYRKQVQGQIVCRVQKNYRVAETLASRYCWQRQGGTPYFVSTGRSTIWCGSVGSSCNPERCMALAKVRGPSSASCLKKRISSKLYDELLTIIESGSPKARIGCIS